MAGAEAILGCGALWASGKTPSGRGSQQPSEKFRRCWRTAAEMKEDGGECRAQPGRLPTLSGRPSGRCHSSQSSGSWGVSAIAADFGKKEILLLNTLSFHTGVCCGKGRQSCY